MFRRAFPFAAAALIAACSGGSEDLVVSGRVEVDSIRVGSKIGGRVASVPVEEGQPIAAGAPVLLLDDAELKAQLDAANAAVAQAQAELDLLLAGTREEDLVRARAIVEARDAELRLRRAGFRAEEIQEARAQLDSARSAYELARKDLDRVTAMTATGAIRQEDIDLRRSALETAKASVAIAEQRVALRESGSRPEEIAMADAALSQAKAELLRLERGARAEEIASRRAALEASKANAARIRTQLDEMRIVSPAAAVVETLDLKPGDLVRAGEPVAVLNLQAQPWIRCYVPENRLGLVRPGATVSVSVDSWPGESFTGTVRRVNAEAEFTPRNVQTTEKRVELVFEMKVDIPDGGDRLRAGMYADVTILR